MRSQTDRRCRVDAASGATYSGRQGAEVPLEHLIELVALLGFACLVGWAIGAIVRGVARAIGRGVAEGFNDELEAQAMLNQLAEALKDERDRPD